MKRYPPIFSTQNALPKLDFQLRADTDFGKGRQSEMLTDGKVSANTGIFLNENQALRLMGVYTRFEAALSQSAFTDRAHASRHGFFGFRSQVCGGR
jgi:hypothetical protein